MSRSAYDVGREALRLWRSVHGNASLNQQCQRFDGYYWQWAYQGNENIIPYGTATAAANASSIYTSNINDPNAQPGDLWYWWWASDGHVATVLGHDAAGRVLVTHTSSSGDAVEQWTNNVRISHADTIPLKFRGGSHTDGANARRTGLTAWPIQKSTPTPVVEEEDEEMVRPICIAKTTTGQNVEVTIFNFDTGEEHTFISTRDATGHSYNTNVALTYGCAPQVPISYVSGSHYDKIKSENAATRKRLAKATA